jgi:hypothetical protein
MDKLIYKEEDFEWFPKEIKCDFDEKNPHHKLFYVNPKLTKENTQNCYQCILCNRKFILKVEEQKIQQ